MVWFYPSISQISLIENFCLSIPLWSDFIKTRPKTTHELRTGFQSHYGLILSKMIKLDEIVAWLAFNPTMVWFYHLLIYLTVLFVALFQSHYGLILSGIIVCFCESQYYAFNPTMVWFYLNEKSTGNQKSTWLSIPLWSDFIRSKYNKRIKEKVRFQSHYGLILSACKVVWAGLNTITFNPTMVWFYHNSAS